MGLRVSAWHFERQFFEGRTVKTNRKPVFSSWQAAIRTCRDKESANKHNKVAARIESLSRTPEKTSSTKRTQPLQVLQNNHARTILEAGGLQKLKNNVRHTLRALRLRASRVTKTMVARKQHLTLATYSSLPMRASHVTKTMVARKRHLTLATYRRHGPGLRAFREVSLGEDVDERELSGGDAAAREPIRDVPLLLRPKLRLRRDVWIPAQRIASYNRTHSQCINRCLSTLLSPFASDPQACEQTRDETRETAEWGLWGESE